MEEKLTKLIEELEHNLEHAEEEKSAALQNARMQVAELNGRLTQRIEDMKGQLEVLRNLQNGEEPV